MLSQLFKIDNQLIAIIGIAVVNRVPILCSRWQERNHREKPKRPLPQKIPALFSPAKAKQRRARITAVGNLIKSASETSAALAKKDVDLVRESADFAIQRLKK